VTPGEIAALLTAAAALATSTAALVRWRREGRGLDVQTGLSYEELDTKRRERIEELETLLEDSERTATSFERRHGEALLEIATLKQECLHLRSGVPQNLVINRILSKPDGDIARLLARSDNLWCITKTRRGDDGTAPATFLWVDEKWVEAFGWPLERWLGEGWLSLLHPADRERTLRAEARASFTGGRMTNRYLGADGTYRDTEWEWAPYNGEGTTLAFIRPFGPEEDSKP
jgi:PAS domain-containing protein